VDPGSPIRTCANTEAGLTAPARADCIARLRPQFSDFRIDPRIADDLRRFVRKKFTLIAGDHFSSSRQPVGPIFRDRVSQ